MALFFKFLNYNYANMNSEECPTINFDKNFLQLIDIQFEHLKLTSQKFETIQIKISMIQTLINYPQTYKIWQNNIQHFKSCLMDALIIPLKSKCSDLEFYSLKARIHLVFTQIPYSKRLYKSINQIIEKDLNNWVIIEGTIIRSIQRKTLEKSKVFKCIECGYTERLFTTYNNNYRFQINIQCPNRVQKEKTDNMLSKLFQKLDHRKSKSKDNKNGETKKISICGNKKFEPLEENKIFVDYQEIKIQEPFKHISSGRIPRTISIILEGIFIDEFRPGDNITVTGLLTQRYIKLTRDSKLQSEMIIVANNILSKKVMNKEKFEDFDNQNLSQISFSLENEFKLYSEEERVVKEIIFRNEIIQSFCPQLYSKNSVKLAVLLALLGGVPYYHQNTRIRGQSHLLLVGEPGTGKSVLLKSAADLAQRSFFTNAIGSTTAGLTLSHVKQGGSWVIQAGALVLADSGVCCIDELNLLNKKDYPSLLQAMEQQTISSAKAGVIGKLNCRTTVIAACNPIKPGQKYDENYDICENTGLSSPLISRFDLIVVLNDQINAQQDMKKCNYILENFINNENTIYDTKKNKKHTLKLKSIIKKAKTFAPEITEEKLLTNYFIYIRKKETKTARALESLCRLSQAHAKLMWREQANLFDCISVINLIEGKYINDVYQYQEQKERLREFIS